MYFPSETSYYAISMKKSHKITFYFHIKRKILRPKIWSLGTYLGSLGPGSQEALDEIFSFSQILLYFDPNNIPGVVACREKAETPKIFPA